MEMRKSEKLCSICNEPYLGYGHLAHPINKGYCCDKCHKIVLQARFRMGMDFGEEWE
tara:strand:+ start:930 stop:1100 length:171 start_codon:yes stop_codon:yes gene_type:complete